jgi:Uma2 family endonuclease
MTLAEDVLITTEDYQLLPETGPRYQVIEGRLCMAPAPNRYHQDISRNIEFILLKYLEKHPIGALYDAPFDVYIDNHNVFQPDLAFFANERRSVLSDRGAEGAPNFVVEILSPRTAQLDRDPKRRVYARAGVEELWIIDPNKETIEVFLLQKDSEHPAAVHRSKSRFTSACFPGLTFRGTQIFAR